MLHVRTRRAHCTTRYVPYIAQVLAKLAGAIEDGFGTGKRKAASGQRQEQTSRLEAQAQHPVLALHPVLFQVAQQAPFTPITQLQRHARWVHRPRGKTCFCHRTDGKSQLRHRRVTRTMEVAGTFFLSVCDPKRLKKTTEKTEQRRGGARCCAWLRQHVHLSTGEIIFSVTALLDWGSDGAYLYDVLVWTGAWGDGYAPNVQQAMDCVLALQGRG